MAIAQESISQTTAPESIDNSWAPSDARAVLEIDLDALLANWKQLKDVAAPAECAGVVKADAYGLGLEEIVTELSEAGCETFFVASLEEGRRARMISPGAKIYILDGLLPGAEDYYKGFNLQPVLSSMPEIDEWAGICKDLGRRLPAAIHVDTGMHRLGISSDELDRLVLDNITDEFAPTLVMSHLACADEQAHSANAQQLEAFESVRQRLPDIPASLANSGGTFLGSDYHYDLVRPGIALYGGRAFDSAPNPMRPVVTLSARILQVQDVKPGETVGYGAAHHVQKPARIATIACGYADGFLRALGGDDTHTGAVGYIGDYSVPIVGRVSMDLITLDVTDVPESLAHRGGWVEVMGGRVTVDDLTDRAGTIGYELLSRLSRRVHRVYRKRQ